MTIEQPHRDRDEDDLLEPGQHAVDVPMVCVLTRFGFRSPSALLATYRDYRRVATEAAASRGLLRSCFLVESPTAGCTLSIWRDPTAIGWFGTEVLSHVQAGNRVFSRLNYFDGRGPELFSTRWRLVSVSHNLNWGDFDFRREVRLEQT